VNLRSLFAKFLYANPNIRLLR